MLVTVFTVDKADEQAFLEAWRDEALFMQQQPGFISAQRHRAIGESATYLNYAVWETTIHIRAALTHPEFGTRFAAYPSSTTVSAHLFQLVGVPDIYVS